MEFLGNGNSLCFDGDGGYMDNSYQNPPNCALKTNVFVVYKLDLNKVDLKK